MLPVYTYVCVCILQCVYCSVYIAVCLMSSILCTICDYMDVTWST